MYNSSQGCHTATGTHMPHGITQCYLPPGRGDIPAYVQFSLMFYTSIGLLYLSSQLLLCIMYALRFRASFSARQFSCLAVGMIEGGTCSFKQTQNDCLKCASVINLQWYCVPRIDAALLVFIQPAMIYTNTSRLDNLLRSCLGALWRLA